MQQTSFTPKTGGDFESHAERPTGEGSPDFQTFWAVKGDDVCSLIMHSQILKAVLAVVGCLLHQRQLFLVLCTWPSC